MLNSIPLLGYNINSVYDKMLSHGWALRDIIAYPQTITPNATEYHFIGGDFNIKIKYWPFYNNEKDVYGITVERIKKYTPELEIFSYSYGFNYHYQVMNAISIPLGDMMRLLFDNPMTFEMRFNQYRIENILEVL